MSDEWKDKSFTEEQARDHAQMMARVLKCYIEELQKIGLSRQESIDAGIRIIVAGYGAYQGDE